MLRGFTATSTEVYIQGAHESLLLYKSLNNGGYRDMFRELDEPTNLLEDAWLDQAIFNLKHKVWMSDYERWRKWIRSL